MKIPLTQKMLMDWAGARVYHYGKTLFEERRVLSVEYNHPIVQGTIDHGPRGLNSRFEILPDGSADNQCPCRDCRERGIICLHVIALAMELMHRQADPARQQKAAEERRHAERLAAYDEREYVQRVPLNTPGAIPAKLALTLDARWQAQLAEGRIGLSTDLIQRRQRTPIGEASTEIPYTFPKHDENLLFVLEDIAGGPPPSHLFISNADFINLLDLCRGKTLACQDHNQPLQVQSTAAATSVHMDVDLDSGQLVLKISALCPGDNPSAPPPVYIIAHHAGWLFRNNTFQPLEVLLPAPLHGIYRTAIHIERPAVPHFLQHELAIIMAHLPVHTQVTEDMFQIVPAQPRFHLVARGSPASLAFTLLARYDEIELIAGKPEIAGSFALPDPEDILRYFVRNPVSEQEALARLEHMGISGRRGDRLQPIIGCNHVLSFLGTTLPQLHRLGWKIQLEGPVHDYMEELDFALPVIRVHTPPSTGEPWFDIGFNFENREGESLSSADIQRAIQKGEAFIDRKNGRSPILIDTDAIETARQVFTDCSGSEGAQPGTFRLSSIYSAYVQASLQTLDGVDVEAPPAWLEAARRRNRKDRLEPIDLPEQARILRPYQRDGVYWIDFLARQQLCGILADEMGLGKTLQTLIWLLHLHRKHDALPPSLVVCPTSLVENWAEEAARFTPELAILILSGAERHKRMEQLPDAQLVITSYALIRRDIEHYRNLEFSAIILDEAQHIKNRGTQNAVAAKSLRARHKLVLTGTPVENSVADLWSIMDFLMPRYLGPYQHFRDLYELPIARGGPEGQAAQTKLRRKLHPFLLRRLKKDVAKELPDKIERVIACSLSKDQQLVYNEILQTSRQKIYSMVEQKGFNHSRMEILKVLLRLRQICCHLDLLKLDDLQSTHPSAKLELFFELFDEALDSGHRLLVFSQFTSMLAILKRELEARQRSFCYLDGATKNRMHVVRTFNTDRSIPAFLISLKAGGTGLNLTGADMVIHFDPWWNPAVEDQATDRAYRIGQKKTVYSVKMITRGTVEDKVLAMQKKKKQVINATLADSTSMSKAITWDDVQDLLAL